MMETQKQTNLFRDEADFSPVLLSGTERAFFLEWSKEEKRKGETKASIIRTRSAASERKAVEAAVKEDTISFLPSWKIVVFDVETTGLPEDWKAPVSDVDNWPRIVEIAFTVAEISLDGFDVLKVESSEMIIEPDGFEIPQEVVDLHGIDNEKAELEGIPINVALDRFLAALSGVDFIAAHNINFDSKVTRCELFRRGIENSLLNKLPRICTMMQAQKIFRKWKSLEYLHEHLFNEGFSGAHRAGADVDATLRCLIPMLQDGTIDLKKEVQKCL